MLIRTLFFFLPLFCVATLCSLANAYPAFTGDPGPHDSKPQPDPNNVQREECRIESPNPHTESAILSECGCTDPECRVAGNTQVYGSGDNWCESMFGAGAWCTLAFIDTPKPSCSMFDDKSISADEEYCVQILTPQWQKGECPDGYMKDFLHYNYNGEAFFGGCDRLIPDCPFPIETEYGKSCGSESFEPIEDGRDQVCPDGYASISDAGSHEGCIQKGPNDTLSDACPTGYFYDRACIECVRYGSSPTCNNQDQNKKSYSDDDSESPPDIARELDRPLDYTDFWKYQFGLDKNRNNQLDSIDGQLRSLNKNVKNLGNSGSGDVNVNVDNSGVESRLDSINNNLTAIDDQRRLDAQAEKDEFDADFNDLSALDSFVNSNQASSLNLGSITENAITDERFLSGSCPPPYPLKLTMATIEIEFDRVCEMAVTLGQFVVISAWLAAAGIVTGTSISGRRR